MPTSLKIFLQSLGCPKNLVDSETMLGLLEQAGYQPCAEPGQADLLVINTCGFIQSAVEEAVDEILALASLKQADPAKRLVVTGCLVQRYGAELQKELPEVDLFIGTDGFQDLPRHLQQLTPPAPLVRCQTPAFLPDHTLPRRLSTPPHRAYLKVTEGCANRCAYCLIPSIRGPLRSRPLGDLLTEARHLEHLGVKELTLIAQDLTSYGLEQGQGSQLHSLLENLLAESRFPWIRLLYLHPCRVDLPLLELIASESRILPYLEIPLQHINSRLLQAMNRPYDRPQVESLLEDVRRILPEAALRTTFMVGFPGETEREVDELAEFIARQRFDHLGIFTYSNEEGCAASAFPDQVPEDEKERRRARLMERQADISLEKNQRRIGMIEQVLVEGLSRETDLLLEGRTRFQAPEIDGCVYINSGRCLPGDLVDVRLTEAHPYDLIGEIVETAEEAQPA